MTVRGIVLEGLRTPFFLMSLMAAEGRPRLQSYTTQLPSQDMKRIALFE